MLILHSFLGFVVLSVVVVALSVYWIQSKRDHDRRVDRLEVRVMVNGIRGKSTVTRLLAGILREGGFVTVAKTTGSAARVIDPSGRETPIKRSGAPTILEQIDIIREHVTPGVEAFVAECMALKPRYQEYSRSHILKPNITVITNVRLDHQEEMGESLEEIADALALTIPPGGVLITSEEEPEIRERLRRHAAKRDARFVYAGRGSVRDEDVRDFGYLQFRQNIAIGFALARIFGIGRVAALRGMRKAVPDIGAIRVTEHEIRGKSVLWIPMFAVNDLESVILTFGMLRGYYHEDDTVIGILNNRSDRGRRAEAFADFVPESLNDQLDHLITFGAYEDQVTRRLVENGYPRERITNLGETVDPTLDDILDAIADRIEGPRGVLVGMVNIHTKQAEMLREYFRVEEEPDELELSREPHRMSPAVQRRRRARAREHVMRTHA